MLSQTAEYALRAVLWLARQGDHPRTTREIAEATGVPAGYLSKILQRLVRHDLIGSRRGPHGGFQMLVNPEDLSAHDVVEIVDPTRQGPDRHTHGGGEPGAAGLEDLHRQLKEVHESFEQALARVTIAELLEGKDQDATPAGD